MESLGAMLARLVQQWMGHGQPEPVAGFNPATAPAPILNEPEVARFIEPQINYDVPFGNLPAGVQDQLRTARKMREMVYELEL